MRPDVTHVLLCAKYNNIKQCRHITGRVNYSSLAAKHRSKVWQPRHRTSPGLVQHGSVARSGDLKLVALRITRQLTGTIRQQRRWSADARSGRCLASFYTSREAGRACVRRISKNYNRRRQSRPAPRRAGTGWSAAAADEPAEARRATPCSR